MSNILSDYSILFQLKNRPSPHHWSNVDGHPGISPFHKASVSSWSHLVLGSRTVEITKRSEVCEFLVMMNDEWRVKVRLRPRRSNLLWNLYGELSVSLDSVNCNCNICWKNDVQLRVCRGFLNLRIQPRSIPYICFHTRHHRSFTQ